MSATTLSNRPIARAMDHAFGLGHTFSLGNALGLGHALGHDQYLSVRTHTLVAERAYEHARQAVARRVPAEPVAPAAVQPAPVAVHPAPAVAGSAAAADVPAVTDAQPVPTVPAVSGRAALRPWRGLLALL